MQSVNEQILDGFAKRDRVIIDSFIAEQKERVESFIKSNGGNHEDAEDIMQDALLALLYIVDNETINVKNNLSHFFYGIYSRLWFLEFRNSFLYKVSSSNVYKVKLYKKNKDES